MVAGPAELPSDRLGGKLVVVENNDYRLNAGGRREFAPDSPLERDGFEPSVPQGAHRPRQPSQTGSQAAAGLSVVGCRLGSGRVLTFPSSTRCTNAPRCAGMS